jgi:hypothetical protein
VRLSVDGPFAALQGIMAAPKGETADGHELHFGVNHLVRVPTSQALPTGLLGCLAAADLCACKLCSSLAT